MAYLIKIKLSSAAEAQKEEIGEETWVLAHLLLKCMSDISQDLALLG